MTDQSSNNNRIAKNTMMLYIRTFVMMVISLYTSRVVLQALGVEDFGLYNVIGGIVVFFSFINTAMVASTQRFLNFEIGRNDEKEAQRVFSASLNIYIYIVIGFIIVAETLGIWFLNEYIKIPSGREVAANWVYQATIATTALKFIRTPYNAAIIAYERMSFYAYASIVEAILSLGIVYFLPLLADQLIGYAWLTFLVSVIMLTAYIVFCLKSFDICQHKFFDYDKQRYKSLVSFSGWSLLGSVANLCGSQGINILLNIFLGVIVNAAMGVASQVSAGISQFVGSFQTAFNPQIIKSYAAEEKERFISLILRTSKYSYYLLFVVALPCFVCCEEILQIWLGDVPPHAVSFCQIMMIYLLIDAFQGPLWVSAQATGRIRNYQLLMSGIILLNIPLGYIVLKYTNCAELALIVRVLLNFLSAVARVLYLKHIYCFPALQYLKEVTFSIIVTSLVAILIYILHLHMEGWLGALVTIVVSIILSIITIYFIGLNNNERTFIKTLVTSRIVKH